MTKILLILLPLALLFVFFSAHAFLPPTASARLFKLRRESKLWVRLIGIFGLGWIALTLLTDPQLRLSELSSPPNIDLVKAKSYLIGMAIGLGVALLTERYDRRSKE